MAEDGVDLGQMQAKLLEKIEELTLHVIALKRENEALKQKIDAKGNRALRTTIADPLP